MRILATGGGDVRSRLLVAFLGFHPLNKDHFPPEFQGEWTRIIGELTKFGSVYNDEGEVLCGSVENTLKRIQNRTGEKIAAKIFDIGWELHTNAKYL